MESTPRDERAPRPASQGANNSGTATTATVAPLTVTALAVTPLWDTRDVVVRCPHCGRRHQHGWPYGPDRHPGHRLAHCASGRGYVIVAAVAS